MCCQKLHHWQNNGQRSHSTCMYAQHSSSQRLLYNYPVQWGSSLNRLFLSGLVCSKKSGGPRLVILWSHTSRKLSQTFVAASLERHLVSKFLTNLDQLWKKTSIGRYKCLSLNPKKHDTVLTSYLNAKICACQIDTHYRLAIYSDGCNPLGRRGPPSQTQSIWRIDTKASDPWQSVSYAARRVAITQETQPLKRWRLSLWRSNTLHTTWLGTLEFDKHDTLERVYFNQYIY